MAPETLQQRLSAAIGDRYDVLQRVGAGGMASVYLVRHRLHGGFCAVKVLSERLAEDPALVKSFFQEARASAALDGHPNIVSIVDIAEAEGVYYLIMKYVEGEDLSSYLKRHGAMRWQEAAYILDKVAEALTWAHARGVVHRDLKPSNIRLGPHGRVTVLDFGIAKVGATPSTFTQMGARAGTPHYMAPEQIRGRKSDRRSDLYSLGVIGFELVTGRRPFEGENREGIWYAHVNEPPPSLEELAPKCPEPLRHILNKLLEKEPEKRYQTADKVVEHLRRLGASAPPETLAPRSSDDLEKWRETAAVAEDFTPPTPTSRSGATPAPTPGTRTHMGATRTHTGTQRTTASDGADASDRPFAGVGGDEPSGSKTPLVIAAAALALLLAVALIVFAFRGSDEPPVEAETPALGQPPVAGSPDGADPAGDGSAPGGPDSEAMGAGGESGSATGSAAGSETVDAGAPDPPPADPPPTPRPTPPAAKKTSPRPEPSGPTQAEIERAKARLRGELGGGSDEKEPEP